MKRQNLGLLAFTLIYLSLFIGCNKKNESVNPGNNKNIWPTWSKRVALYDEMGNRMPSDSGVIVKLSGTPGDTSIVVTKNDGIWTLNNLDETKTYYLSLEKEGYGTLKKENAMFPDDFYSVELYQKSSSVADGLTFSNRFGGFFVDGMINPAGTAQSPRTVRYFIGLDSLVSPVHSDTTIRITDITSNAFTWGTNKESFVNMGYPIGTKLYVVAYGEVNYKSQDYLYVGRDKSGHLIYPAMNSHKSNVVSFTVE